MKTNGECPNNLFIDLTNIKGTQQPTTCKKVDLSCHVSFKVSNFDLDSPAGVRLKLSELESYCTDIVMKIQTTSSIPDGISSITTTISSDKYKYFIGSDPSNFKLTMTPSLFLTDTNEWDTDLEGYHISLLEEPTEGSQVDFSE